MRALLCCIGLFTFTLAASGCSPLLPGYTPDRVLSCGDLVRADGYSIVSVDTSSYPRYQRFVYGSPLAPECTVEALATPGSRYRSRAACQAASLVYAAEKGYLYGVCMPDNSLRYMLSRTPERLDTQRPEGFEPVIVGQTYTHLGSLRVLPVRDTTVYRGPSEIGYVTEQRIHDPDDVPVELFNLYQPLASDALFGRYVRVGLHTDSLAAPGR